MILYLKENGRSEGKITNFSIFRTTSTYIFKTIYVNFEYVYKPIP